MANEGAECAALRERVKELTCLYGLSQLADCPSATLESILQGAVDLLPSAWQYPEIAAGRITWNGQSYVSANYREGGPTQSAAFVVKGRGRGCIEVAYLEEGPAVYEGPFLREERHLIDAVARQIALVIDRREAEAESVRMRDQLRHADRLATIGQLAAGVAHELNEPLGHILGFAQLAQKQPGLPGPAAQDVGKIVEMCLYARQIISQLLLFSRQTPLRKTPMCLNTVVEEALCLLQPRCAKKGIDVVRRLSAGLPVITADASQLRQVLVDLAVNAIHAMPGGGTLEIATAALDGRVVLSVRDTGLGMAPDVLTEIFIPFFTTKDVNEGTGLGLPVVHGIVTSHGGTIRVESAPGKGSTFEIELPIEAGGHADGVMTHGVAS